MKRYGWSDRELATASNKMTYWYKAKLGFADVIQIVGECDSVPRHSWTDEQGRFRSSMCSKDDHGSCPYCDLLEHEPSHKFTLVYATTVVHLTRKSRDAEAARWVGQVLAWRFGDDKKDQLIEAGEASGDLRKALLRVIVKGNDVQAEQFQNLTINPLPPNKAKEVWAGLSDAQKNAIKKLLKKDNMDRIERLYHPTPEDLQKFLDADKEAGRFEPEDVEKKGKKPLKTREEPDEDDDDSPWGKTEKGDLSEDEETEEETEEEEEAPPPKKGKKAPPAKKGKKVVEEEDEDDDDDPLKDLTDDE